MRFSGSIERTCPLCGTTVKDPWGGNPNWDRHMKRHQERQDYVPRGYKRKVKRAQA